MNCPFCNKEMIAGNTSIYEYGSFIIHDCATIKFTSYDKSIKKKGTSGDEVAGWYCERCEKIIGAFKVHTLF